jgi:hypothetical protein
VLTGVVAVAITTAGWLQAPDELTRAEAVAAATSAFEAAGVEGAIVQPRATAGVYPASDGSAPIEVWKTVADLEDGTVELWLARADGQSVFLDDRTPDGTSQVLSDAQFEELARHHENPAVPRQVRRNLVLTVAAALVALVGVTLARHPFAHPGNATDQETSRDRAAPSRRAVGPGGAPAPPQRASRPLRAEERQGQRVVHRREADDLPA